MTTISYRDRPVAVVGHRLAFTIPSAGDQLPRPFVAAMCQYALDIHDGLIDGPYDQADAETYARIYLIDPSELDCRDDAWLARRFHVPIEQIALARQDPSVE